jgi:hypothetical protein
MNQSTDQSLPETKECPFCAETILANAIKCKHCGEFLDGTSIRDKQSAASPKQVQARSSVADGARIGLGFFWVWVAIGIVIAAVVFLRENLDTGDPDSNRINLVVILALLLVVFCGLVGLARKGRKAMERDKREGR